MLNIHPFWDRIAGHSNSVQLFEWHAHSTYHGDVNFICPVDGEVQLPIGEGHGAHGDSHLDAVLLGAHAICVGGI